METCEASDKQVEVQSNVNQVLVECLRKADDVCVPFLSEEEKERKKKQIIAAYSYYGVEVEQVVVHEGSAVSLYEITVKRGTRVMLVRPEGLYISESHPLNESYSDDELKLRLFTLKEQ